MAILSGLGKTKLNGKKELTAMKPIMVLDEPDFVYIPLVGGASTDFEVHVQEGDKVSVGTKIATRNDMYVPIFSSVSGTVKGIEKRMHGTGRPQNHVVIENDHQQIKIEAFSFEDVDNWDDKKIVEGIKEMGMVGLGGSGFPTYIKYGNCEGIHTVLINGVECEPYITADYVLMKQETEALIDGLCLLMKASGVTKGIIAIKTDKKELIEQLKVEASKHSGIEVKAVKNAYPLGWERTLIREIFKKEYDRFPIELGIVVNNASTAIYISKALRTNEALTHRIVTFSGEGLKDPQNVLVPIGTSVDYIIDKIGGYADIEEGVVINGGPMMGKAMMNDQIVITAPCNAITVLPKPVVDELPCLRCGLCTEHCPAKIQPVQIMVAEKRTDIERMKQLETNRCIECGLCSYVCPSKIEVSDWVAKAKRRLALAKK